MDERRKRANIKYIFIFPKQTIMPDVFKKESVRNAMDMQDVEYGLEWPDDWDVKVETKGRSYMGPSDYKLRLVDKSEDMYGSDDPHNVEEKYTFLIWCDIGKLKDVLDFLKFLDMNLRYNFYTYTR